MKRIVLATVVIVVAGAANAGLWCKNTNGETLVWRSHEPRPANAANFGSEAVGVVCIVNSQLYRDLASGALGFRDFPVQAAVPDAANATPTGSGAIYRGNWARWLIDNLPSSYGQYATWEYFEAINP